MTYLDSIFLGALEGLTEFLPVSSTGHLILASHLLGLPQTEFLKTFEIAIQLGSIAAVVVLFFRQFLDLEVLKRLIIAFLPTGIIGFTIYRLVKDLLGDPLIVVLMLALGGAAIIAIERSLGKQEAGDSDVTKLSYRQSFLIGCAQSLALIPGVSRSGATVMGGLLMNIPRATILQFSFLLAVPTMLAATGYDLMKNPEALTGSNLPLLAVGFIVAFAVALLTIRMVMKFVKSHSFAPFGWYRIALAALFYFIIL